MSQPWLDTAATELRIAKRVFQETLGGVTRTRRMSLLIMITMASILSIFGVLLAGVVETQLFFEKMGTELKISVYTQGNLANTVAAIQKQDTVKTVEVITREKAWQDMRQSFDLPDIQNPLPDTIHVTLKDRRFIETAAQSFEKLPGVEAVRYAQKVLLELQKVTRIAWIVGLVVIVYLGLLTLFIISNTIHLLIEARGREIEIMRMMGVGNWYIRLPFLLQGAFYGLMGGLLSYIPIGAAQFYLNNFFTYLNLPNSLDFSFGLSRSLIVLMGILVGAGGSAFSVRKYLKV
jgi:cell division transport system permease protein